MKDHTVVSMNNGSCYLVREPIGEIIGELETCFEYRNPERAFLELTDPDGNPVYLRYDRIETVVPSGGYRRWHHSVSVKGDVCYEI